MRLFQRGPSQRAHEPGAAPSEVSPASLRRPVLNCANCRRPMPPYVYMDNGLDYCVPCARRLRDTMGMRPAGQRDDDIVDLDAV